MLIRNLFLFIALFWLFPAFAQFKPFRPAESQKKWADGKLNWSDFRRTPLEIAPNGSEFIYTLFYYPEKIQTPDTTYFRLRAFAFMNRNDSWVHDSVKTEQNLKYHQVIFNLLEWHRRVLEPRFASFADEPTTLAALNEQQRLFREEIAKLIVETRNGRNEVKVNEWLARSYQQLDSIAEKGPMPRLQPRNYGFSSHMGYGQSYLSGELGNAFGSFSGLDFGSDFRYKKLTLLLNSNFLSGKTITPNASQYDWPSGLPVGLFNLNLGLGYPILNTSHWRITPFAGPARVLILTDREGEVYKDQVIADNTLVYGMQIDWKIRSRVSLLPLRPDHVLSDYGIRTRLIVSPVEYSDKLNGTLFCVSFSLFLNTQYIKILPHNN